MQLLRFLSSFLLFLYLKRLLIDDVNLVKWVARENELNCGFQSWRSNCMPISYMGLFHYGLFLYNFVAFLIFNLFRWIMSSYGTKFVKPVLVKMILSCFCVKFEWSWIDLSFRPPNRSYFCYLSFKLVRWYNSSIIEKDWCM